MFHEFYPIGLKMTTLGSNVLPELRYKSEGRGFDSRRCHWNFSLT